MSVLYVALPVAILMGASALIACIRCIRGGQFDDLETPAVRMLIDDPVATGSAAKSSQSNSESRSDVG